MNSIRHILPKKQKEESIYKENMGYGGEKFAQTVIGNLLFIANFVHFYLKLNSLLITLYAYNICAMASLVYEKTSRDDFKNDFTRHFEINWQKMEFENVHVAKCLLRPDHRDLTTEA
ncbi:hypothetical protein TNCV_4643061 [Trichonephila clavipes]|nr:hypothetical protein TNCV_4643061 [Trichonephila clavipes]